MVGGDNGSPLTLTNGFRCRYALTGAVWPRSTGEPMQRLITLFVSAYWTAYFGLLALASMARATGDPGPAAAFAPSFGFLEGTGDSPALAGALAFGCALSAALFAWTLLDAAMRPGMRRTDGDDVPRLALGVSIGVVTLVMVAGLAQPDVPVQSTFILFIALLASYVAIHLEQAALTRRRLQDVAEPSSMARMMALGAAHTSLLPRLSGRSELDTGKGS